MGRIMVRGDINTIDEAFLVHKSGCLIGYHTQEENVQVDYDLVAGMLTAVQSFVKDTFGAGQWSLKKLEFENKNIMIELGENFYLAIVYNGKASTKLQFMVEKVMQSIEEDYGEIGEDWDGDMESLEGTAEHIQKLFTGEIDDIPQVEYCQLCGAIIEPDAEKCPICEFDFSVIQG